MVPYLVRLTVGATIGALIATGILLLIGVDDLIPTVVGAGFASAIGAVWAVSPEEDDEDDEDEGGDE